MEAKALISIYPIDIPYILFSYIAVMTFTSS